MSRGSFSWSGFGIRLLFALILVYATYNPEGYSYYDWIKSSIALHEESGILASNPVKYLAGLLLLIGWIVYINATRASLGIVGVVLLLALGGGVVWLFAEMNWFDPANIRAIVHLTLIVIAFILAVGMSWSHIRRSWTGQVDVDETEH